MVSDLALIVLNAALPSFDQKGTNPHATLTVDQRKQVESLLTVLTAFTPSQQNFLGDAVKRLGWGTNWTGRLA